MNKLTFVLSCLTIISCAPKKEKQKTVKPRILISTDIGGTDPDDNQSMIHFLMYSDQFDTEGLVSSPSYGFGTKQDILETIALYEKDLSKLKKYSDEFPSADSLRFVTKQGRKGAAPYVGYATSTEGSDWIIKCAKEESERVLWVLVWGGLEDLAQALHDAPEIASAIKVYWIGGPNKKWSTNSYMYIVEHFPNLWFIEANATYRGFFSKSNVPDSLLNENYYDNYIQESGHLGESFKEYYDGNIKMGDTPSLLYVMNGEPDNPLDDSWGGSFEKFSHSPRFIFDRYTTVADTVSVYSIVEYHFDGPELNIPKDSTCFTMTVHAGVGEQEWPGFYLGDGKYGIRYAPKASETLTYEITSKIPGFPEQKGQLVVNNDWPGAPSKSYYELGTNWYSDSSDPELFDNEWQGAKTVLKWRSDVLFDWAKRWAWLQE
ncbi:nucleoside hydrolase-like domain-containing protein [Ulvibacterium sp.]|uniref:nucleoside hydrolase-like domain-containing protein n=1 Tax=Ulvibacterium sp. TaxID=2665914 RepID=UPI003CC622EC